MPSTSPKATSSRSTATRRRRSSAGSWSIRSRSPGCSCSAGGAPSSVRAPTPIPRTAPPPCRAPWYPRSPTTSGRGSSSTSPGPTSTRTSSTSASAGTTTASPSLRSPVRGWVHHHRKEGSKLPEISSTFKFIFPDEQTRQDFEVEFKGWMKQYQRQLAIYRMLAVTRGEPVQVTDGTGTTAALTAGATATTEPHHFDGTDSGLLTIGATTITLSDGTTISTEGVYLDLCPWF